MVKKAVCLLRWYLRPGAVLELTDAFGDQHGRMVAVSYHFNGGIKKSVLLSQEIPPGACSAN
jgi:hypothetical protein